jgi:hypothetical protein
LGDDARMPRSFAMLALSLAACTVAGCTPAEPPLLIDDSEAPATLVGNEAPTPVEKVRTAIREEATRLYADECGEVLLPDRAFEPVEITGGGLPEYAVLLGRGTCVRDGSSGRWLGSGGAVVQVWLASGGPPRMLLEHQMHGFLPVPRGFLGLQHGGFCPGGAGPGMCLVQYEWNDRDRTLEVAHRRLYDYQHPGTPPRMSFDYETISR